MDSSRKFYKTTRRIIRSFNNASCCILLFFVVALEEKQGINGKHMQCDVKVIHVKWGEINECL